DPATAARRQGAHVVEKPCRHGTPCCWCDSRFGGQYATRMAEQEQAEQGQTQTSCAAGKANRAGHAVVPFRAWRWCPVCTGMLAKAARPRQIERRERRAEARSARRPCVPAQPRSVGAESPGAAAGCATARLPSALT